MKRRWLTILLALLAVVFVAHATVRSLPLARLQPVIERELTEALGLAVEIGGPPHIELLPRLHLAIEDLRIANLPGRASPLLLEIRDVELEMRILPLLRRMFVIETLELSGGELWIEPDGEGRWSLQPDLTEIDEAADAEDEADAVRLQLRELVIRDLDVYFDPAGEGTVTTLEIEDLAVESADLESPLWIEARGAFEGGSFEIDAKTGSLAELVEPTGSFAVDLRARLFEGRFEATGTLGHPRTLRGMDLEFGATLADPAARARDFGLALPPLGSFVVAGRLMEREGRLAVESLSARSQEDGPVRLAIEGDIDDLIRMEGVDLELRVDARDLGIFESLTSLPLSGVPMNAGLDLNDDDGSLGVEGELEAARPGFFELDMEGVFDDLRRFSNLDLRIALETSTLSILSDVLAERVPLRLPDVGPMEAGGRLVLVDEKLGLDEIEIRVGDPEKSWARVDGSVADLLGMRGVALEAKVGARSARALAALFGHAIPDVGSLSASFSLRDDDGTLGFESASLEVGRPDEFSLKASGVFDDLRDLEEIDVDAILEARDLSALSALADLELPRIGPVRFAGKVHGAAERLVAQGELRVDRSILEGDLEASLPSDGRPSFDLRLRSLELSLPDLLADPRGSASRPVEERHDGRDIAAWWRGEQPLSLDALRGFDATLRLEAKHITGYELLALDALELSARLENGHLVIEDAAAEYESGRVAGRMELDARPEVPELELELEAFNVDLTRLVSQFQRDTGYAGLLDVSIDLSTKGRTGPEARSNLEGLFGAMLRDGAIVNRYARAFSFDVLRVSIPSFRRAPVTEAPVHCLLAVLPIAGGIAEIDTLYLEGQRITINGTGRVDLGRGELDLRLTPHLHDPGLLSVAAEVDVEGPIEDPSIRPIRKSMVTSALGALFRNAMRPAHAVGRMIRGGRGGSDAEGEDPCGAVARKRVGQMRTATVEPIVLEETSARSE